MTNPIYVDHDDDNETIVSTHKLLIGKGANTIYAANVSRVLAEADFSKVSRGDMFPLSPKNGFVHVFNAAVGNGLVWKNTDGTTDLTSANNQDVAIYNGDNWIKLGSLGDGGTSLTGSEIVTLLEGLSGNNRLDKSAIDRLLDKYKGTWSAGPFDIDDLVIHSSAIYRCKVARTTSHTDNPSIDTTGWESVGGSGSADSAQQIIDKIDGDTGGDVNFSREGTGTSASLRGTLRDDSIGIAELSATGTASATTFLAGDNSWKEVTNATGADGDSQDVIYRQGASAPPDPSGGTWDGSTFTPPSGWSKTRPALTGDNKLYISFVTLGGDGSTITYDGVIDTSGAVGPAGSEWSDGLAFPGSPSTGDYHLFSGDVLSALSWRDTNGVTILTTASRGDYARYDGTNWIKVGSLTGDTGTRGVTGGRGTDGNSTDWIFQQATSSPSTPSGGVWNGTDFTPPSGWTKSPPILTAGNKIYGSKVTLSGTGSGITYAVPIQFTGEPGTSGGDTASAIAERDISWSSVAANAAVLTNLAVPSTAKTIYIAFRKDDTNSWVGGFEIPYSIWNAYSTVAAGTALTDSNSWAYQNDAVNSGIIETDVWRIGKGTGGVIAVSSSGTTNARQRFDKIAVYWTVSGSGGGSGVISSITANEGLGGGGSNNAVTIGIEDAGIEVAKLGTSVLERIDGRNSILSSWDGLGDPLSQGWLSNVSGKYDSTNLIWPVIGSAATVPANDRNNQLYTDNNTVEWDKAFVFRWTQRFTHHPNAANDLGSIQVFWGADKAASPAWLGSYSQGVGLWTSRVRTLSNFVDARYDNYLYVGLRTQGATTGAPAKVHLGFLSNDPAYTTLYNGALLPRTSTPYLQNSGNLQNAGIGFFIPETNPISDIRVQGSGGYIRLFVNGILYARIRVSDISGLTYGPRFGWLGDNNGYNGNVCLLYNAFIGNPDPINILPLETDGRTIVDGSIPDTALEEDYVLDGDPRNNPRPTNRSSDAKKISALNAGGTAYELVDFPEPEDPPSNFIDQDDTPNTYIGQALRYVQVNPDATGLRFIAASPSSGGIGGQSDSSVTQQLFAASFFWRTSAAPTINSLNALSPTISYGASGWENLPTNANPEPATAYSAGSGNFYEIRRYVNRTSSGYAFSGNWLVLSSAEVSLEFADDAEGTNASGTPTGNSTHRRYRNLYDGARSDWEPINEVSTWHNIVTTSLFRTTRTPGVTITLTDTFDLAFVNAVNFRLSKQTSGGSNRWTTSRYVRRFWDAILDISPFNTVAAYESPSTLGAEDHTLLIRANQWGEMGIAQTSEVSPGTFSEDYFSDIALNCAFIIDTSGFITKVHLWNWASLRQYGEIKIDIR